MGCAAAYQPSHLKELLADDRRDTEEKFSVLSNEKVQEGHGVEIGLEYVAQSPDRDTVG
jgi:hypothetical protein